MNTLSGYKKINIGGKQRPFKMGMNASYLICEELKIPIEKLGEAIGSENMVKNIIVIIWAGLYAGCKYDKIDVDFDRWDVGNWIDDLEQEKFAEIITSITGVNMASFPSGTKKKGKLSKSHGKMSLKKG